MQIRKVKTKKRLGNKDKEKNRKKQNNQQNLFTYIEEKRGETIKRKQ